MSELTVLQAIRLKGRVNQADLAATLGEPPADVATTLARLTEAGLLVAGTSLRLSADGRARIDEYLAEERHGIDSAALAGVYDAFRPVNAEFKAVVTDWQLKDGRANSHRDADYDAAVLARLDGVHRRVVPIVARAAAQLPRLGRYAARLDAALSKVRAGDTGWLTRPTIDSYHTVWFELHEELILAAGLARAGEESGDVR